MGWLDCILGRYYLRGLLSLKERSLPAQREVGAPGAPEKLDGAIF